MQFTCKINGRVRAYNMDARDFIKKAIQDLKNPSIITEMNITASKESLKQRNKKQKLDPMINPNQELSKSHFDHFVMNLPASASSFLDAFKGLFSKEEILPMIHVYCFSKSENPKEDAVKVISIVDEVYRILKKYWEYPSRKILLKFMILEMWHQKSECFVSASVFQV